MPQPPVFLYPDGTPVRPVRYLNENGDILWTSPSHDVPPYRVGASFTSQYVEYTVKKIAVVKGIEQITLHANNICPRCKGLVTLFGRREFTVIPPLVRCPGHKS